VRDKVEVIEVTASNKIIRHVFNINKTMYAPAGSASLR
jgi:hypothetical protein